METPSQTQLKNVRIFISHYLKDACKEIENWHNTGSMPKESIIGQASRMLSDPVFFGNELNLVEREVNNQAITYVSEYYP